MQYGPEPLRIDAEQNFQGTGPDAGMITELAIDPRGTTDQVIYQSNNDGGIWKTTDGGATWTPMTDFMPSNSMGAVTLDAGNPSIVYAGTGNLGNNGYFNPIGVYRSVDAGQTWTNVAKAVFGSRGINRMTSPAANVLLVATNNGLFKSIDGGTSFGTAPSFTNGSPVLGGNISDLHLDTTAANTVFASVNGSGIFQSTDGGSTWGANLFTATNGAPTANLNFISFSQSTSPNNQTIYASVGGGTPCPATGPKPNGCGYNNLYVSTDGGANWTAQGTGAGSAFVAATACQCGYDQTIGVDPADANKLYIGFQRLFYSSNGGAGPFNAVSDNKIHWDEHAIVFSPATHPSLGPETRVWVGNDGGVARSDDAGSTWANLNETVSTNLFRGLDIGRGSAANNVYAYTGTQDTGTIGHRPGDAGRDWHLGIDGDGNLVAVDWCDPQHVVGTDNGGYSQTSNGGNTWGGGGGFPAGTSLGNPAFDPRCADRTPGNRIVYFGGTTNLGDGPPATIQVNLFRSSDNGGSYSVMKQFASSNAGVAGITAIATSPLDSNVVWVGFSDGTIQRTADALQGSSATWTPVAVTGSPGTGDRRDRARPLEHAGRGRDVRGLHLDQSGDDPDEARLPHDRQRLHLDRRQRPRGRRRGQLPRPPDALGRDRPRHLAALDHRLERRRRDALARQRADVAAPRRRPTDRRQHAARARLRRRPARPARGHVRPQLVRADRSDRAGARREHRPRLRQRRCRPAGDADRAGLQRRHERSPHLGDQQAVRRPGLHDLPDAADADDHPAGRGARLHDPVRADDARQPVGDLPHPERRSLRSRTTSCRRAARA